MYLSYMNHTLSYSFSLNLSADMRATYWKTLFCLLKNNVKALAPWFPNVLIMSTIMTIKNANVEIQKIPKDVIWSKLLKNQVLHFNVGWIIEVWSNGKNFSKFLIIKVLFWEIYKLFVFYVLFVFMQINITFHVDS